MKRALISVLLIISIILVASCGMADRIVGTWKTQASVLGVVTETTFVFNEDGTGTMGTVLDIAVPMTYTIDGDMLYITTNTLGIENVSEYTISFDGDKLVLRNESETLTFTKAE